MSLDSFQKLYREEHQKIPENTAKGLQAIPAEFWPLYGSICEFKFDRQMSSGATDQAKVLQLAAFRDHGLGHVPR